MPASGPKCVVEYLSKQQKTSLVVNVNKLATCKGQQGSWLVDVTIGGKTEKSIRQHQESGE
jgi:hypothetical protein